MTSEPMGDLPVYPLDLDEAVTAALDEVDSPAPDAEGKPWRVEDEGQADWAARKLAKCRSAFAAAESLAERQRRAILDAIQPHLDAIDSWLVGERTRIGSEIEHWEVLLFEFHRARLAEDPRAKTIRLPHGTLSARKNPDTWDFSDAFVDWAREYHPSLLREQVTKPAAKKALTLTPEGGVVVTYGEPETGELNAQMVPGVTVVSGEVRFSVDTEEVKGG